MPSFDIPHDYTPNRGDSRQELADGEGDRCLACGEEQGHAYHKATKPIEDTDWVGDNPFWLLFERPGDEGNVGVDLDAGGWIEANKGLLRSPGTVHLMAKRTNRSLFIVLMEEGDQFYYTKRHVGNLMAGREVVAYGIGKKKADGSTVNLWLMPNGTVCGGADVDVLAARMI